MVSENKEKVNFLESASLRITEWVGTPYSLIVHSFFFIGIFALSFLGFGRDQVFLVLTTLVSLEAIYLAIFIQMTVNKQAQNLKSVTEDVGDIQENVEELSEDVEEISEDVEDISEDVEEISEDIDTDQKIKASLENIEKQLKSVQEGLDSLQKPV